LIPLLVAAGGFLFFGEPMRRNSLLGLGSGLTGIVLLCLGGGDDDKIDTRFGIGMQLLSSTCYAIHILLISRLGARTNAMAFCFWQLLTVALVAAVAIPLTGGVVKVDQPHPFDFILLVDVLYLGLLATALGIGVQSTVQPRIPPTQIALLFATQPGFAAAAGWILRGERLGVLHWLGGTAIVLGIVIASRPRSE
jgi:drug/metabolite transporter (DMT)-like permease